jgi:hypothetical protein
MKSSAYSKMYLVLPSIYDKVLKSIDEKDKKVLEQLNTDKENTVRPSEQYFENVANIELENSPTDAQEMDTSSQFINPETSISNKPEQTFGEPELNEEEVEIIHQNNDTGIKNPLKINCSQTDEQDKFIPMIPSLKRKKITKPKYNTKQNPQIQRVKTLDTIEHDIKNPKLKVTFPNKVTPLKDIPKNFVCNFCSKRFKSTYHLNRHVNGVHKELVKTSDPMQSQNITQHEELVSTQPQVFPKQVSDNFQNWQNDLNTSKPSRKRRTTTKETKLKYTPKMKKQNEIQEYDEW